MTEYGVEAIVSKRGADEQPDLLSIATKMAKDRLLNAVPAIDPETLETYQEYRPSFVLENGGITEPYYSISVAGEVHDGLSDWIGLNDLLNKGH